ncbi:MAG: MBL fold metallo-hydrolase [Fibrobacterota bacterium]
MKIITSIVFFSIMLLAFDGYSSPSVTIRFSNMLQYEIETPGRHIIYLNARDGHAVSRSPKSTDGLASTNDLLFTRFWTGSTGGRGTSGHMIETLNSDFVDSFPGPLLHLTSGTITLTDAQIEAIPSARLSSIPIVNEPTANFIIVVKAGGLTIVNLGMLGQTELTEDQLVKIKGCDILLMSTLSQWGEVHLESEYPKRWIEQIQPKIIIPMLTSDGLGEVRELLKTRKIYYSPTWNSVKLTRKKIDRIPNGSLLAIDTILMAWAEEKFNGLKF